MLSLLLPNIDCASPRYFKNTGAVGKTRTVMCRICLPLGKPDIKVSPFEISANSPCCTTDAGHSFRASNITFSLSFEHGPHQSARIGVFIFFGARPAATTCYYSAANFTRVFSMDVFSRSLLTEIPPPPPAFEVMKFALSVTARWQNRDRNVLAIDDL